MKKLFVFITILLVVMTNNSSGGIFDFFSKSGPSDINIKKITKETEKIINNVIQLSSEYVIDKIKENNRMISEMHSDLKPGFFGEKSDDKKFDIIFNSVEDMRSFYIQLSEKKDMVRKNLEKSLATIDNFVDEQNKALRQEERYLSNLKEELASVEKKYDGTDRKVKQNATKIRIDLTKQRIEMLNNFIKNYSKVKPKLDGANSQIESFIFLIVENAKVYDEAYKTLSLKKDLKSAYATINNFTSLESISKDLMNSWGDLKEIVAILTKQADEFEKMK